MSVWVEIIRAIMDLSDACDEKIYLMLSDGWYLLTARDSLEDTGQNDFEARKVRSPASFVLFSGSEDIPLLVCSPSSTYVLYSMAKKENLAKLLRLKKLSSQGILFSSEIGTCDIDDLADRALTGTKRTHLIYLSSDIKHAEVFGCGTGFKVRRRPESSSKEKERNTM